MRIDAPALRIGQPDLGSLFEDLRAPCRGVERRVPRSTSICSPQRMTGLSAVIGSWKIIAMRVQRSASSRRSEAPTAPRRRADRAAGHRERARQQSHGRVRDHALAGAGFADEAHDLVRRDRQAHALDRVRAIGAPRQPDRQAGDLEDGRAHAQDRRIPSRCARRSRVQCSRPPRLGLYDLSLAMTKGCAHPGNDRYLSQHPPRSIPGAAVKCIGASQRERSKSASASANCQSAAR